VVDRYEEFCRARGWRWELLTQSRTDIGGFTAAQANVSGALCCLLICLQCVVASLVYSSAALRVTHTAIALLVTATSAAATAAAGEDVYEYMKFESGVHRVQRVPVNDSKIQTSAASVVIMPEPTDVEVNIRPQDLKIDLYRSQGAGGK
jgi:protein subunit release factor A